MRNSKARSTAVLVATTSLLLGCGTAALAAWSSSGSSWGGSTTKPSCSASNITLSLTQTDCLRCHPGSDEAQVLAHHNLIRTKNMMCLDCHQFNAANQLITPVTRDCIVCHKSSVHDTVTHCVQDSCGGCHSGSLPQIHAGRSGSGSYSSSYSYHSGSTSVNGGASVCYLCHASTNSTVTHTVLKGLSGQTIACSDCHGGGR